MQTDPSPAPTADGTPSPSPSPSPCFMRRRLGFDAYPVGRVGLVHYPTDLDKEPVKGEPHSWDDLPAHLQMHVAKLAAVQSMDAYIAYCRTRNSIRRYIHPLYLMRMLSHVRNRSDSHHRIADKWLAMQPCDSDLQPKSEEHSFLFDSKRVYYRVLGYGLVTYTRHYFPTPGVKARILSECFDMQVSLPVGLNPPLCQ